MTINITPDLALRVYLLYRQLRSEGKSRGLAMDIIGESDYAFLSRKQLKEIIKGHKKAWRKTVKHENRRGNR